MPNTAHQTLTSKALHTLSRTTFGYSTELLADVRRFKSIDHWLADQLRVPNGQTSNTINSWFPRLTSDSPAEAQVHAAAGDHADWQYGYDLAAWTLARRILSKNQLHEVMVDFWSSLLYVPSGDPSSFAWRYDYDRVIRRYALTSFPKLLKACITHPAMIGFLTANQNSASAINENLGRELLELHTVGVGNFSEDDVKASAKMLTGFTLDISRTWNFTYDPTRHWVGPLEILGKTFQNSAADGRAELSAYLEWLGNHNLTAARISTRLCQRLVSDKPSTAIVATVRKAYLRSGGDIASCILAIVGHPDFLNSRSHKVRPPADDVVAAARAANLRPTGMASNSALDLLTWCCSYVGYRPFSWPRPDGPPEMTSYYITPARLLRSWTIHTYIANMDSTWPHAKHASPAAALPPGQRFTLAELVHWQHVNLTGRRAPASVLTAAAQLLGRKCTSQYHRADVSNWTLTQLRGLILSSPGVLRK